MRLTRIRLRLKETPTAFPPGRGFYQVDEDALSVCIGASESDRHFFSYLESDSLRLDINKHGELLFLELNTPRRLWPIEDALQPPVAAERISIRFLDFRATLPEYSIATNATQSLLKITFSNGLAHRKFQIAESLVAQISESNDLIAIWVTEIEDDFAGQKLSAFQQQLRVPSVGD